MVNSRLGSFAAAPGCLGCKTRHSRRHSFSRSYGVVLPSSLTGVLSRALGFSPRLPVSVCGTGTGKLARGFSRQHGIGPFATYSSLPITSRAFVRRICLPHTLHAWTGTSITRRYLPFCVTPLLKRLRGGTGISTCCPSSTPFGLDLGPDSP